MPGSNIRDRLRKKANHDSPLAQAMDDATFERVEALVMAKHHREMGGPPGENDPAALAQHLCWWSRIHPGGEIDYQNPENVAYHVLCYHANRRLMQRVQKLPLEDRQHVLMALSGATSSSSSS